MFVTIAAMISTYGILAGCTLNAPRAAYAFPARGDFPRFLSQLHSRHHTPAKAIVTYAALVWLLALTGTCSLTVMYIGICAALVRAPFPLNTKQNPSPASPEKSETHQATFTQSRQIATLEPPQSR